MQNKIHISHNKQKYFIYTALAIITLAVFWQVHQFDFVNLDELIYIKNNIYVQSGITWHGLYWALTTKQIGLWTPLTMISLMIDYELYGLNPGGYHMTNLILHILSALFLFWLFCRMTRQIWPSAFVAAFFALHPLHVESVAWVSERKDVLSAFFWMLTLCLYVYYTEKPVLKRYLLVLFSFVLALMSKPMVVTLPLIMILLDYWPLKRFELNKNKIILWQFKEKLPLFVLSAIHLIISFYPLDKSTTIIKQFFSTVRMTNASVFFLTYLEKTFWPYNMSTFYLFPDHFPIWQAWGSLMMMFVITIAVIVTAEICRCFLVGWFWYSIALLPILGLMQINDPNVMGDRYHYLPSIGIAMILAWGIPLLLPNKNMRKKILLPTAIAFLAFLTFFTWQQCGHWKNSKTLFNHALQVTKNNYMAYNNLGAILYKEGNIMGAIYQYNKAINIKPDFALSYLNRGNAYIMIGNYQQAIEDYKEAINRKNDCADAYNNKALIYLFQGKTIAGCSDAQKACSLGICTTLEEAKHKGYCN